MKWILAILFMPMIAFGQLRGVMVNTNGNVWTPTNFFYTNFIAGANITLTPTFSNLTITATSGSGDAGGTNARQFGTLALTNLSGNPYVGYTNIAAFQATNSNLTDWSLYSTNTLKDTATNTVKWLTNLWGDIARGFGGLSDGQVLKYHGASATWTNGTDNTGGGGGGLTTNANQFGASVELAIKDGVNLTNVVVTGSISISNEPTGTVPTNTLYMGTDNYAGRIVPEWKDHNQLLTAFQPAFYNNRMTCFLPSSGTTIGIFGVNASTTGGTTVSHPSPNNFLPYMVQLATPATSNGTASAFSGVDLASSGPQNTAGANGYFYSSEWTVTNGTFAVNGGGSPRIFVGLTALASPNLTNLVVTTNATGQYIGLYASPRDSTEMWISARDSGNEFRTNTGMTCVTSNLYQFYLFNAPTSRFAGWKIKNLTAGTSATGWFSNNVPTNFMKFGIAVKNSTSLVHSVRFTKQYLEAPLAP